MQVGHPGDRVWMTPSWLSDDGKHKDRKKLAGIVLDRSYACKVETTEDVRRVCVRVEPNRQSSDVRLHRNDKGEFWAEYVSDGIRISSADIRTKMGVLSRGSSFDWISVCEPQMGETVAVYITGMSPNVGVELAEALEGWHWIWEQSSVAARVVSAAHAVYRVRSQYAPDEPPLADVDRDQGSGELFSNIQAGALSVRCDTPPMTVPV